MGSNRLSLTTLYEVVLISNNSCSSINIAFAKDSGITRHYKFDIKLQNVTRLCHTKSIVTVNGQFPGPRIVAREGVWFMHCHLEVHTSWGLKMAWIVLDGKLPNQKLLPPPADLPKC
ncbi:hypothetical protein L1049_014113 [Liquidambar formosana]|uniref:Plastocyanin-like domain-containing protein n=1 Tax=Liquidambar formosana TaxID=63359 RepID=A0AAP0RLQ3_LIQFO